MKHMTEELNPGALLAKIRWAKEIPDPEKMRKMQKRSVIARRRNKKKRLASESEE